MITTKFIGIIDNNTTMKTILITGASSGIGLACAKKLHKGNRLILCSRRIHLLEKLKESLGEEENIYIFQTDVTKEKQVRTLFKNIYDNNISPELVINSAGVALGLDSLDKGSICDWNKMINTNIKGLLMISKFALKEMKRKNYGHIINIGSIAGINSYSGGIVYSATKASVKSISDGLRKEVIEKNIRITNIQPGLVETNFSNIRFKGDMEKAKNVYKGIKPLTGDDIADIIKYIIKLPLHIQINEITVTPVHQATVEIVYKEL
jgi:3-hydroxy acid dehydrogenase / malonic semialdehyde reductase